MKHFTVWFSSGRSSNWTNVTAMSENQARSKVRRLLKENYPTTNFKIVSVDPSEQSPITLGSQFVYQNDTYMWLEQKDANTYIAMNLTNNEEYNVTLDSFNDIVSVEKSGSTEIKPKPITPGPNVGIASVLNSLIIDEYEAIEGYNSAIVTAQMEGYDEIVKILTDIQAEEQLHVGQLQRAMELVDPNAKNVLNGMSEAEEQIEESSDDLTDSDANTLMNAYDNHVKETTYNEK